MTSRQSCLMVFAVQCSLKSRVFAASHEIAAIYKPYTFQVISQLNANCYIIAALELISDRQKTIRKYSDYHFGLLFGQNWTFLRHHCGRTFFAICWHFIHLIFSCGSKQSMFLCRTSGWSPEKEMAGYGKYKSIEQNELKASKVKGLLM